LRLRGPTGAQDEFTLAAIAQNLRKIHSSQMDLRYLLCNIGLKTTHL
jgi:hypothetical protein